MVTANRDMEPILSCVDAAGRAAGYGHLRGGLVLSCSTALARQLLGKPPPQFLRDLGAAAPFEMAVGLNGRLWVDAYSAAGTVDVSLALQAAEKDV